MIFKTHGRIIIICKQSFPDLKAISLQGLVLLPYQLLKTLLCELKDKPIRSNVSTSTFRRTVPLHHGCLRLFLDNTIIDKFNPPLFLERIKLKCILSSSSMSYFTLFS